MSNLPPRPLLPPPPPGGAAAPPPPPPPPTAAVPVLQPADHARRRGRIGWIVAGSIAIGIVALGVFGSLFLGEALFTRDMLSADFSDDDDTFFTGETADYRSEVRDGRYRLTATTSSPSVPLENVGHFKREEVGYFKLTPNDVDIQVDVVAVDAGAQAVVGLECVHSASGGVAGARYVFTVGFGDEPYRLWFFPDQRHPTQPRLAVESGPPLRAGQRLGLQCNDHSITGLIDDTAVVSFADPTIETFRAAALMFWADTKGDWVEFDNVTAVVPEH